jgi:hypothetical protein
VRNQSREGVKNWSNIGADSQIIFSVGASLISELNDLAFQFAVSASREFASRRRKPTGIDVLRISSSPHLADTDHPDRTGMAGGRSLPPRCAFRNETIACRGHRFGVYMRPVHFENLPTSLSGDRSKMKQPGGSKGRVRILPLQISPGWEPRWVSRAVEICLGFG